MRDLIKIVEGAVQDIGFDRIIHNAWVKTYTYVYDGGKLRDINIKNRDGVCVFMRDVEDIDPVFNKTCLAFLPYEAGKFDRSASTHHAKPPAHGCDTFVVFQTRSADKDGVLGALSPSEQYMFNHEMVHVLDYYRFKSPDTMSYPDPHDSVAYYNDPAELNAYFHNIAEPLLSRMSLITSDGIEALDLYEPLPRDFTEFLTQRVKTLYHEPLKKFWSHLNEQNKRRVLTRLYSLFNEFWKVVDNA